METFFIFYIYEQSVGILILWYPFYYQCKSLEWITQFGWCYQCIFCPMEETRKNLINLYHFHYLHPENLRYTNFIRNLKNWFLKPANYKKKHSSPIFWGGSAVPDIWKLFKRKKWINSLMRIFQGNLWLLLFDFKHNGVGFVSPEEPLILSG